MSTTSAPASRGYRPGPWFGIFGDHAVVLLPPSEKHRVGDLWAHVDDGAGFDVVLDALISGGLRDLPGFLLVSTEDDVTKVVVRGDVRARFTLADGEQVELDGTRASTWAERSLTGVGETRIDLDAADPGPLLPILGGLVRVGVVEVSAAVDTPPPPSPPDPEPEPEPEPGPDHDGDTLAGRSASPDPQDPDPWASSGPVARLVFSHGDDVVVDGTVLVGRSPEARRHTSGEQPRLVRVPSPQQEISSTHLEFRPGAAADHGSAVVTDLGSTNGTVLVQPGLPPEDLQPGVAVSLVPGAILDLGDSVTIQVANP